MVSFGCFIAAILSTYISATLFLGSKEITQIMGYDSLGDISMTYNTSTASYAYIYSLYFTISHHHLLSLPLIIISLALQHLLPSSQAMSIEYPTTAHLRHRKVNSLNKVQDGQTLSYKDLHNQQKHLTIINRLRIFLLNDGLSYLFIAVWVLISSLVFGLGFVHYDLNDEYVGGKCTFKRTRRCSHNTSAYNIW